MQIIHTVLKKTGLTKSELYTKLIENGVTITRQGFYKAVKRRGEFIKIDLFLGLIKVGRLSPKIAVQELFAEEPFKSKLDID